MSVIFVVVIPNITKISKCSAVHLHWIRMNLNRLNSILFVFLFLCWIKKRGEKRHQIFCDEEWREKKINKDKISKKRLRRAGHWITAKSIKPLCTYCTYFFPILFYCCCCCCCLFSSLRWSSSKSTNLKKEIFCLVHCIYGMLLFKRIATK